MGKTHEVIVQLKSFSEIFFQFSIFSSIHTYFIDFSSLLLSKKMANFRGNDVFKAI